MIMGIKQLIYRDKENLARFFKIVVLSSIPVLTLLTLIRVFNTNYYNDLDITSLVLSINAGIFMENDGIYNEKPIKSYTKIISIAMIMFCIVSYIIVFIHKHQILEIPSFNERFESVFFIFIMALCIVSILLGMIFALKSNVRVLTQPRR